MKRILIVVGVLLLMFTVTASASESKPWTPENVELAYPEEGWFCMWTDGEFNGCWSCCDECYNTEVVIEKEVYNKEVVKETPEPKPTPEPQPTPKPAKEKCNAGRGNDSEGSPDCDPGNSGGHNKGGD